MLLSCPAFDAEGNISDYTKIDRDHGARPVNQWGEGVKTANKAIGNAVDELGNLITLFQRDISGHVTPP